MTASVIKPINIGKVKLKNNLIMAPMAGITDTPFRLLAKEGGAGLVCSEMLSANALQHNDRKTLSMLDVSENEHPVSVQIFGSNPEAMGEAAKVVEAAGADIVDINFGCPVRKIVRSGAGAKMLENETLMTSIMETVMKSVKVPVTIKIRTGLTKEENVAPLLAKRAEKCGVSAIVVHGRSADMHHKGNANFEAIKQTVEAVTIPVIGNGGIVDEETALEFFTKTGCGGLMIGRAAVENPEIFLRIEYFVKNGARMDKPSWEKKTGFLKKHAILAEQYYGEGLGLRLLRKLAPYYFKGLPHASRLRDGFNKITTMPQLDELLTEVWKSPFFEGENE